VLKKYIMYLYQVTSLVLVDNDRCCDLLLQRIPQGSTLRPISFQTYTPINDFFNWVKINFILDNMYLQMMQQLWPIRVSR
jgi:hypothetical protein